VDKSRAFKPGIPAHPGEQPCGTTRTLVGCWLQICPHHVPTPLCSTVITRFFALTRALTPTDPLTIGRGSLIHVTRTSNHSISNHLRISAGRVHSLCANSTILFGLRHCSVGSSDTADRIEFTVSSFGGRRYGLVVHFQLLPTRGYRLGAVTFSYWLYSVSQVRDSHPAVQVRSQAHGAGTARPIPVKARHVKWDRRGPWVGTLSFRLARVIRASVPARVPSWFCACVLGPCGRF